MSKKGLGKFVLGAGIGEKVEKIAKKKAKELQRKAEDLVDLAKEKGTPVLEGIADDLKHKVICVCTEIINKLEKGE